MSKFDHLDIKDTSEIQIVPGQASGPISRVALKGHFIIQHFNKDGELLDTYEVPNGITDVGLNAILDVKFNTGSQITTWYIGLMDNSGFTAVAAADTLASHSGWAETTAYSGSRPAWTSGAASSRSVTNSSSVDFAINATKTIKGIFICSAASGTSGELWSTATFGSTVAVNNGDTLKVTYTVSG